MNCFASLVVIPKFSDNPKLLIPYIIPKLTAFAILLWFLFTPSILILNISEAVLEWISWLLLKASFNDSTFGKDCSICSS